MIRRVGGISGYHFYLPENLAAFFAAIAPNLRILDLSTLDSRSAGRVWEMINHAPNLDTLRIPVFFPTLLRHDGTFPPKITGIEYTALSMSMQAPNPPEALLEAIGRSESLVQWRTAKIGVFTSPHPLESHPRAASKLRNLGIHSPDSNSLGRFAACCPNLESLYVPFYRAPVPRDFWTIVSRLPRRSKYRCFRMMDGRIGWTKRTRLAK